MNKEPLTSSIIRIACRVDTAGLKNELLGMVNLVRHVRNQDQSGISATVNDSAYTLKISPRLDEQELTDLKAILNAVMRDTTSIYKPPLLKIRITESDPEVLKLLNLRKGQEFPISLDQSKICIKKATQDMTAGYPGDALRLSSFIYVPAINPLPNTKYTYGVDGEETQLTQAFKTTVAALGGFDAAHKIVVDNSSLQSFADSLLINPGLTIDSTGLEINVESFYFDLAHRYMPTFDDDSIYNKTLHKLPLLQSYYYRLLLTPNRSAKMKGFVIM